MSALLRTRVGKYKLQDANKFISLEKMFDIDKIQLENEITLNRFINGIDIDNKNAKTIYKGKEKISDTLASIYYNNNFIGIAEKINGDLIKRKIIVDE